MSARIYDGVPQFNWRRGMANLSRQFWQRHGWDRIPVKGEEHDRALDAIMKDREQRAKK